MAATATPRSPRPTTSTLLGCGKFSSCPPASHLPSCGEDSGTGPAAYGVRRPRERAPHGQPPQKARQAPATLACSGLPLRRREEVRRRPSRQPRGARRLLGLLLAVPAAPGAGHHPWHRAARPLGAAALHPELRAHELPRHRRLSLI